MLSELAHRFRQRMMLCDHRAAKALRRVHPKLYLHLRWPFKKPYQRPALTIIPPGGGFGDELIASGVIAEIKRRNPDCQISLITRRPDYWIGHPLLAGTLPDTPENRTKATVLAYHYQTPTTDNALQIVAERVGLLIDTLVPQPPVREAAANLQATLAALPGPYILIQPESSTWTPNKTWPEKSWHVLLPKLLELAPVVELGTRSIFNQPVDHPNFVSLAGKSAPEDLAWIYQRARLYLGPDSAGMHLAAAFQIPAVILFGGYTIMENFPYPTNIPLTAPTDCAPCWLRSPCPYELKCLRGIGPDQVLKAVREIPAKT